MSDNRYYVKLANQLHFASSARCAPGRHPFVAGSQLPFVCNGQAEQVKVADLPVSRYVNFGELKCLAERNVAGQN
jgi:hypothetical protein